MYFFLSASYSVDIQSFRNLDGDCETEVYLFLYGDEDCIEQYLVTIYVDDVQMFSEPRDRGFIRDIHFINQLGNYRVEIDDGLGCVWSYDTDSYL